MTPRQPDDRHPGSSEPDGPERVATEDRGVGDAVEQLLDAVESEPRAEPALLGGGVRGRTAIVTGGSRGIGRAIAIALARTGADVAFNYLEDHGGAREDALRTARELRELEVRVLCRAVDVRDSGAVDAFVEEVVEELGAPHILVNNAGIARDGALWRMEDDDWRDVVETNLGGTFRFTRAVAPHFRAREDGKIVNVASVHGLRTEFGISNYTSSKAGIIGFTRAAAEELGSYNINVNAVAPGYIRTTRLTESVPAEVLDRAREESALGRLGDPQDVAHVVLFLCSEAARHLTGVVVPVDGGYLL